MSADNDEGGATTHGYDVREQEEMGNAARDCRIAIVSERLQNGGGKERQRDEGNAGLTAGAYCV